jgi:hypothetical protein
MNKKLFFVGLILAASGLLSPPRAMLGGLVYGLALSHPFHVESRQLAKFLLPASVVALGFGMNLHGPARVDGDAASDRDRAEQGDAQEGWRSATSAGDHTVDHRWRGTLSLILSHWIGVVATRNPGELRAKLLFIN